MPWRPLGTGRHLWCGVLRSRKYARTFLGMQGATAPQNYLIASKNKQIPIWQFLTSFTTNIPLKCHMRGYKPNCFLLAPLAALFCTSILKMMPRPLLRWLVETLNLPGFHYPSWRPELTGDRFPLPVNTGRVDGRAFPLAEMTGRVG